MTVFIILFIKVREYPIIALSFYFIYIPMELELINHPVDCLSHPPVAWSGRRGIWPPTFSQRDTGVRTLGFWIGRGAFAR